MLSGTSSNRSETVVSANLKLCLLLLPSRIVFNTGAKLIIKTDFKRNYLFKLNVKQLLYITRNLSKSRNEFVCSMKFLLNVTGRINITVIRILETDSPSYQSRAYRQTWVHHRASWMMDPKTTLIRWICNWWIPGLWGSRWNNGIEIVRIATGWRKRD